MIRTLLVLILLLLPESAPAMSATARIEPAPARLGEPVRLSYPLPKGDWHLPGLPDFDSLELLTGPQIIDGTLWLELLPLRPGQARIPELTLTNGPRAIRTADTSLQVIDPVPVDAEPAGRLDAPPLASDGTFPAGLAMLALLTGLAMLAAWHLARRRRVAFPKAERRLLARLPAGPERDRLAQDLEIWLYSPYRPEREDLRAWWQRARRLESQR